MKDWKRIWEKWTNWELWPFNLIYAPLGPLWLWYAAKAKCFWYFTPTDPTLTFAGFEGEGKKEMYDLLPEGSYPKTAYASPSQSFEEIKNIITQKGFTYPLCVKPESGLKGLLFRKVDSEEKLLSYHQRVPVDYIIQELVEAPLEVSVFYYRYPNQQKGTISGFIQKEMMHLFGDGRSTLWELILEHPKAKHRLEEMRIKHEQQLDTVIPKGEKYILTHAANLNRGARFTNLQGQIDERLREIFDPLSHRCQFYYGRYDLKCNSIEELKEGKFIILEFNGTGAEPNHVYNAGFSWFKALGEFAHHWKVMYEIGKYNNRHNGVRYWGNREGYLFLQQARKHAAILEKADREIMI
ncbi:hypothetical protein HRG84_11505 [Flavisolibacter sp. BT320]|nr:hypothetical protein [Flavisolibacter longurius]